MYSAAAVLVLLASLLAMIYIGRVVEVAYFRPPTGCAATADEAPLRMLIPMYAVLATSLLFGVWTVFPVGMAMDAAQAILGAAQ
jgi:multicomponent Na+:H+ antiporter subunit D